MGPTARKSVSGFLTKSYTNWVKLDRGIVMHTCIHVHVKAKIKKVYKAPISLECDNWRLVRELFATILRQRLTI